MPRVTHVKKAKKDNPVCKAGESYYWWAFRYGGKRYSLTPPKPSQLTNSPYFSGVRALIEQIEDTTMSEPGDLEILRDEIVGEITGLGEQAQESLDNIEPEGLKEGPTGQMLQERVEACESAASELESMDMEFTSELDEDDKDITDADKEEELDAWLMDQQSEMAEFVGGCEV